MKRFLAWLRGAIGTLGLGTPEAMMMLEGSTPGSKVRAHWASKPLMVYVDGDDALFRRVHDACVWWNLTVGASVFMFPEVPLRELLDKFDDPKRRPLIHAAALVRGGGDDPTHGHTDLEHDPHTGELRSAVVTLPDAPATRSIDRHELGHALGLAHVPAWEGSVYVGTLMERFMDERDDLVPTAYQVKALRGMGT